MKIKSILIVTLITVSLQISQTSLAGAKHGGDKHAVVAFSGMDTEAAQTVKQFHAALNTKDKKLARSLLSNDVVIYEGGGVERSAEEYANHHMIADMNYLAAVDVKTIEQHVKVYGDIAVSISRSKTQGTYKGKAINSSGMETIILKKVSGKWKINHIHWSN